MLELCDRGSHIGAASSCQHENQKHTGMQSAAIKPPDQGLNLAGVHSTGPHIYSLVPKMSNSTGSTGPQFLHRMTQCHISQCTTNIKLSYLNPPPTLINTNGYLTLSKHVVWELVTTLWLVLQHVNLSQCCFCQGYLTNYELAQPYSGFW